MIKIGITGGIGGGKSVVTELFRLHDIPVYVADEEAKWLTNHSPAIREALIARFGSALYTPQGLDRKQLAEQIFGHPDRLKEVNAIIHPEVNRHFQAWTEGLPNRICALESAILFESGFDQQVDISLMVCAPQELRVARAQARDGASREDILRRINSQLPDEEKIKLANHLIHNDNLHALLPQVEKFLAMF